MSLVAVILASFLLPIGALESGKQQSGAGLWAQTAAGFGVRQRALRQLFMWQTPPWLVVVFSATMDRRWTCTRS